MSRSVEELTTELRKFCLRRGPKGILGFGKVFRRMDDNQNGMLTISELKNGLEETGLQFNDEEYEALFAAFDRDSSNSINYNEFLKSIRPPVNELRLSLVNAAFEIMDKTGDGIVSFDDVRQAYNLESHPEYGKKEDDEIIREFLANFEEEGSKDGKVTKDEFYDYYSGVSSSIDDDEYFELMMKRAWKLNE